MTYYLAKKRTEVEAERIQRLDGNRRNVHLGNHLPSLGIGQDYFVPTGSRNGELVEVVIQGPGVDSSSSMLLMSC